MSSFVSSLSPADFRDIIGLIMVALGVFGDLLLLIPWVKKLLKIPFNPTDFEQLEYRKKVCEICFSALIVIGLGLEVSAWPQRIKEIESLKNENLQLELKLQPRTISVQQMEDFKLYMAHVSKKIPIRICIGQEGNDTETFAKQLRDMFSYAGFRQPSDVGVWGLNRYPTRVQALPLGASNMTADPQIIYFSTNSADFNRKNYIETNYTLRGIGFPNSGLPSTPLATDSDPPEMVFHAIDFGFRDIHISAMWIPENQWVKSNEFEIYVPIRGQ